MANPKIGASIMVCAGLVCTLYVMMLCGSQDMGGGMTFAGVTYTINFTDMKARTRFGWIGVYVTLDGKAVSKTGFDDGRASWFSYDEEKFGLSKSDSKTKDMWKGCSRACPVSFFSALGGLLISSAIFMLLWEDQMGATSNSANSVKLARRKDFWANWVPFWVTLCTLCGVSVILTFGLGCYRNVTAVGAGVPEDMFEANIGGGFIVAIIATCLSAVMMVLVFVYRCSKLGECTDHSKEARGRESTALQRSKSIRTVLP